MNIAALALLAGLVAGIGIADTSLWFLAVPGLALFLYIVLEKAAGWRSAALAGLVVGSCMGGAGVWWMWDMYPLPVPTLMSATSQYVLIGLVWGITALLAGLASALAGTVLFALRRNAFIAGIAGIVWALSEELRMWLYALYSYSPQSLFGPHFSQTSTGYALAESSYLLQLAHPFGVDALNAASAAFAATLALVVSAAHARKTDARLLAALAFSALVLIYPLFDRAPAPSGPRVSVAAIATLESTTPYEMDALVKNAVAGSPDILVLPEGKDSALLDDPDARKALFGTRPLLLARARHESRDGVGETPEIRYEDAQGNVIATYGKIFLMPQGEYLPSIAKLLYPLSGDRNAFAYGENIGERGERGAALAVAREGPIVAGGLLCSEVISPHLYPMLVDGYGANVLLNLSNQSWFHTSQEFYLKMLQIARVQAVATRRYFIEAANDAPSFVLDPSGRTVAASAYGAADVVRADITLP